MTSGVELRAIEACASNGEWRELVECLDLVAGDSFGVIGGCDSGKTALASLMAGIADKGFARGLVSMGGQPIGDMSARRRARLIALVSTDASLVFSGMARTVQCELELSLQVLGYKHDEAVTLAKWVAALRLEPLLARDPFTLSGGERVRVAIALALVKVPTLLLLDDIFGALDQEAADIVRKSLALLRETGSIVVEFHSCPPPWVGEFDRCLHLSSSNFHAHARASLQDDADAVSFRKLPSESARGSLLGCRIADTKISNQLALSARDWAFRYKASGFALGPIDIDLPRGCAVALRGPNGSGKTTLLRTLALLLIADSGSLTVFGATGEPIDPPPARVRHLWAQHVLYAFQNPDDQIYLPTVRAELIETARACARKNFEKAADSVAELLGLDRLLDNSPADIPRPLRRLTTLGACLVARPPVLLLDEPSAGLDADQKQLLCKALQKYLTEGGAALVISHDTRFIEETCSDVVFLAGGSLR